MKWNVFCTYILLAYINGLSPTIYDRNVCVVNCISEIYLLKSNSKITNNNYFYFKYSVICNWAIIL